MANRKQLKKSIKKITGELFADCVALSMCQQADPEKLDELMAEVLVLHNEFVARISHTEPGNTREFYKKLQNDFNSQVQDILQQLSE